VRCKRCEREIEPLARLAAPESARVTTRIEPEQVGDVMPAEGFVKGDVCAQEACVLTSNIEGDERGANCQSLLEVPSAWDARVAICVWRAEIEHVQAARIGRGEVATPGFVGGKYTSAGSVPPSAGDGQSI